MTAAPSTVREYEIHARSTDIFGRVLCSARDHHFVIDGPVQNNCPGEAITPAESFLSGVAGCGIELLHVIAKDMNVKLDRARVKIVGKIDREKQPRADVTVFNEVTLDFELVGPNDTDAKAIVEGFKKRCPLYGTVSVAALNVSVTWKVVAA